MNTFTLTTFRSKVLQDLQKQIHSHYLLHGQVFCACSMHDIGGSRQMAQQLFMSYQYFQEEKSVVNLQTIDTPRQYGAQGYYYYTKLSVSKWFLPQKSSANFYILFSLQMQVQLGKDFDLAQGQKLDHRNQSWLLIHEES